MKQVGAKDDFPFFTPHFSPGGQYSLMGARIDNKPALALADATGKPLRALASLDGLASFSWSPRGALLAYTTRSVGQDGILKLGALHALDVNTGEDRILSRRPVLAFFWSPDGARIAAIGPADGLTPDAFPGISVITENTAKPYALYVLDAATGAARAVLLFEPTPSFDAVLRRFDRFSRGISFWSPDSLRLVLPVQIDGGSQGSLGFVLEMEATGSVNPRVLSVGGTMATWSPR